MLTCLLFSIVFVQWACLIWPKMVRMGIFSHYHFLPVFTFENLIDSFILTIMSDTGTDSDCTICVTNNGDIANVDKNILI